MRRARSHRTDPGHHPGADGPPTRARRRSAAAGVVGLLTVDGDGHTVAAAGPNPCVDDAVAAYLLDGRLPVEGARCPTAP